MNKEIYLLWNYCFVET